MITGRMSDSQQKDCQASAIRLLSRREHSSKELTQKLLGRDFDSHTIESVLALLRDENLQSDDRFAESYVRSKIQKGIGPVRLRREMREHEIDDEMINRHLSGYEWRQLAAEVRLKRFGSTPPQNFEERAKQMRFLQYRGFSTEQINGAMKQDEWESSEQDTNE